MPLQLRDYLDLTVDDARRQWASLAARSMPVPGARQVDFLPIETLTCYGLGLVAPPSASGSISLRRSDPTVRAFAALFRRSEKSLAAKLNNLDGRRPHSARSEQELWAALTSNAPTFAGLAATILEGARLAGLGPDLVPDFLGLESKQFAVVLDAVDISETELEYEALARFGGPALSSADPMTERAMIGTARVGQQQFARRVLASSDFACAFCGLSTRRHGIAPSRMLIASHIKPWRHSSNADRVNPRNGIAACPTHDAAFETHLIGVDRSGRIHRSLEVERAIRSDAAWAGAFGHGVLADRLLLAPASPLPDPVYVDWHWAEAAGLSVEYASGPIT